MGSGLYIVVVLVGVGGVLATPNIGFWLGSQFLWPYIPT